MAWLILLLGGFTLPGAAAAQTDETPVETATPDGADPEDAAPAEDATPVEAAAPETADDVGTTDTVGDDGIAEEPEPEVATNALGAPQGATEAESSEGGSVLEEGDLADPSDSDGDAGEAAEEAAEEASAEDEAPAEEPLAWRNSMFSWTNQVSFNSFLRGAQLSYNPSYQQAYSISPRWYLSPRTFFWANQALQLELTDTDFNALNRDPQLGDTLVEIRHVLPLLGFMFIGSARVGFPVSKASQAAQRYLQTGLGLTVARPIPEIHTMIAGVAAYRRWWAGSNVAQVGEAQPDRCAPGPTPGADATTAPELTSVTCNQLGGPSAGRDILLMGLSATVGPFEGFSFNAQAFLFNVWGFDLAPATLDRGQVLNTQEPVVIADGSPTHLRNFTFVSLSVNYEALPWLNVSAGVQNSGFAASALNPNATVRNPLFTTDTQAFVNLLFNLDGLYNTVVGDDHEELTPQERQRRRQGMAAAESETGAF